MEFYDTCDLDGCFQKREFNNTKLQVIRSDIEKVHLVLYRYMLN